MMNVLLMLGGGEGQGDSIQTMLMFGAIAVVFYFFMIRPQSKKAKEAKNFKASISKGDKIVTIGGVHGKIVEVKETTILLEVENGVKLKIEKSAISPELSTGSGESSLNQKK